MFDHPIFRNRVLGIGYIAIWLFIITLNCCIEYFYCSTPIVENITGNTVFSMMFALLAIPLWYTVCYRPHENDGWMIFGLHHATIASVFILVWFSISHSIIVWIFPEGKWAYLPFEKQLSLGVLQGIMGYTIVIMAYYLHIYARSLREKHEKEMLLQRSLKEVEISMLRSQINPHFLFNSLNSISSLTMVDSTRAQEMIVKLSDYLRYTVSQDNMVMVPLDREMDNIHRYLDIEKVRFGSKLQYQFAISDEALSAELPAMILQPLFENAIKHGVYESTEPILISTKAYLDNGILIITIENNYQEGAPMSKGAGIGLRNIADRLKLIYQNETLLNIKNDNQQFTVTLIIPPPPKSMS